MENASGQMTKAEIVLRKIIGECVANGVVTDWFLFNDRSLRIAPPLTITEVEIRMACGVIVKAIDQGP